MATYSGTNNVTATASVNTVDTVVLTNPGFGVIVTNNSGNFPIYFTVSPIGGACPAPTVNGVSSICAASVAGIRVPVRSPAQFGSVVQLISAGTPQYTVSVAGLHLTD